MQVRFRCKRASKPPGDLDEDRIVDATLLLKPSHHLAEFFNQPLPPALICIYSWIPIQRSRRFACTLAPKPCLHISCCHNLISTFSKPMRKKRENLRICFRPSRAVVDVSSSSKARSSVGTISSMACSPALY
jgi:hypothetical protein